MVCLCVCVCVCVCVSDQGLLSLRQQNTESLLDYLHSAASLMSQLSRIEDRVLSQGWCATLTQPDEMIRYHQVPVLAVKAVLYCSYTVCCWLSGSQNYMHCVDSCVCCHCFETVDQSGMAFTVCQKIVLESDSACG